MTRASTAMRRPSSMTSSVRSAPIRLLTSELAAVAKAFVKMKTRAETLRTRLITASGRSPRCSTAMKKKNQTLTETNDWSMVHTERFSTRRRTAKSKVNIFSSRYLCRSIWQRV